MVSFVPAAFRRRWGLPASSSPHTETVGFDPLGRLQRGCHAVPGAWHVMGVVLAAGGSFQWFRDQLGKAEIEAAKPLGVDPYMILADEAAIIGPGAEGLFFLPYLTGERTPHFDADARGGWIGLTVRHGRPHMIRALLEGDNLRNARQSRTHPRDGRGDRRNSPFRRRRGNALWKQIQADIYGQEVCTINASQGPAFGVALLALVGAGVYSNVPEACDATIKVVNRA